MSDLWAELRTAIVAKMATSAGMRAAGLRTADDAEDIVSGTALPVIKVLNPDWDPGDSSSDEADFFLTFPFELLVGQPGGRVRSNPVASAIMRALQVEWRTGFGLGRSGTVIETHLLPARAELSVYADTGYDGYAGAIYVHVHESVVRSF